jgi:hypothetical protein
MAKIIEVFSQYGIFETVPVPATFTVDNTELFVEAGYDIGHEIHEHVLTNSNENGIFNAADNLNIISAGFSVPFPFACYDEQCIVQMGFANAEGDFVPFPGFGVLGMVFPFENYELPLDLFFSIPDSTMALYKIGAKILSRDLSPLKISMLNIPDVLNGEVFSVSFFLKIAHNLPLT